MEEQFYAVAPALLVFLARFLKNRVDFALVVLFAASFASAMYASVYAQEAGFYLFYNRAWEFIAGILTFRLALPLSPAMRQMVAAVALAALLASMWLIDPSKSWPSFAAVWPCLATCLLIKCHEDAGTLTSRLLSLSPMRWFGKISYSLYLWHWPVIVLARDVFTIQASTGPIIPVSVTLTLVLSYLSWRFVETPLRRSRVGSHTTFTAFAAASAMVIAIAVPVIANDGFPSRFPADVIRLANFEGHFDAAGARCLWKAEGSTANDPRCQAPASGRFDVLIGDSHAAMLASAIASGRLAQITAVGCPVADIVSGVGSPCLSHLRERAGTVDWSRVDRIILTGRWREISGASGSEHAAATIAHFARLAPLTVIGPTPEFRGNVPKLLARARLRHDDGIVAESFDGSVIEIDRKLQQLAGSAGVRYVSALKAACGNDPPARCMVMVGDEPAYTDRDHLTLSGAKILETQMR